MVLFFRVELEGGSVLQRNINKFQLDLYLVIVFFFYFIEVQYLFIYVEWGFVQINCGEVKLILNVVYLNYKYGYVMCYGIYFICIVYIDQLVFYSCDKCLKKVVNKYIYFNNFIVVQGLIGYFFIIYVWLVYLVLDCGLSLS